MQLGKPGRWDAPQAAVGPDLVVVLTPDTYGYTGLMQRLKPLLIEAFVSELSVETLDVAVLHGSPRLDQKVLNAVAVRPAHECPAGELGAIVSSHRQRVAPKQGCTVQDAGHVMA